MKQFDSCLVGRSNVTWLRLLQLKIKEAEARDMVVSPRDVVVVVVVVIFVFVFITVVVLIVVVVVVAVVVASLCFGEEMRYRLGF